MSACVRGRDSKHEAACVSKESSNHSYDVKINDGEDVASILATCIVIDECNNE